jgi:hypothetical protein
VNGGLNTPWAPVDVGKSEVVFLKDTPDGLSPVEDWAVWQVEPLQKTDAPDLLSASGRNGLKSDLSTELASADPQKYIALWKEWWETEGRDEYGTADPQPH